MKRNLFLLLLLGLCLNACQQNDDPSPTDPGTPTTTVHDTLYPKSYLPVYPGSFWEYRQSGSSATVRHESTAWVLDAYTVTGTGFESDSTWVPLYQGRYIWGYDERDQPTTNSGSSPLVRILSDSLATDASWTVSAFQGSGIDRKILDQGLTLTVDGQTFAPTIVIEDYPSNPLAPDSIWYARRYYTQGIGLVMEIDYNNGQPDSLVLTNYMINTP